MGSASKSGLTDSYAVQMTTCSQQYDDADFFDRSIVRSSRRNVSQARSGDLHTVPDGYDRIPAHIEEDPASGQQRRRIQVACARCRKRKIRCSGDKGDGSCENCKASGVDSSQCTFYRVHAMSMSQASDYLCGSADYPPTLGRLHGNLSAEITTTTSSAQEHNDHSPPSPLQQGKTSMKGGHSIGVSFDRHDSITDQSGLKPAYVGPAPQNLRNCYTTASILTNTQTPYDVGTKFRTLSAPSSVPSDRQLPLPHPGCWPTSTISKHLPSLSSHCSNFNVLPSWQVDGSGQISEHSMFRAGGYVPRDHFSVRKPDYLPERHASISHGGGVHTSDTSPIPTLLSAHSNGSFFPLAYPTFCDSSRHSRRDSTCSSYTSGAESGRHIIYAQSTRGNRNIVSDQENMQSYHQTPHALPKLQKGHHRTDQDRPEKRGASGSSEEARASRRRAN